MTHSSFLDLFAKFKDGKGKQAKLKSPDELAAFLDTVKTVQQLLADGAQPAAGPVPERPASAIDGNESDAAMRPSSSGTDAGHKAGAAPCL